MVKHGLIVMLKGIIKNEDGIPKFEENFEEALKNINNSITESKV